MKTLILLACLLISASVSAQLYSMNWYFGTNAGISFATDPPTALTGGMTNTQEGVCAISNSYGDLLFYSDGITVWDRNHAVMPNGTGLLGGASSTQSSIVTPDPGGDTSIYYLFTAPQENSGNPLAYSIIDMDLNNGFGDLTATKNVPLFSPAAEKVTAVYHDNGTDIWIIGHGLSNNTFNAYLLTSSGISATPVVSSIGTAHVGEIGYLKASPCGDRIATAVWEDNFLELFDFSDATGVVSNNIFLGYFTGSSSGVYGLEFSPDDNKLYASVITPGIVVQYDLLAGSAAAIIASADTIGTSSVNFNGALQTGPDARIYLVKYGSSTLDCITEPNLAGSACNYVQDFVSFTGQGALGSPDFFSSFFCKISNVPQLESQQLFSVMPNPATDFIQIQFPATEKGTLQLCDNTGRMVYYQELNNVRKFEMDISNQVPGLYLVIWNNGKEMVSEKIVVVHSGQ